MIAGDVLVFIYFFVAFSAKYIPPSIFWFPQVAAYTLPALSLLLVFYTLWLTYCGQLPRALLFGALVILALVRFLTPFSLVDGKVDGSQDNLTIVTFNAGGGGPELEERVHFSNMIEESGANVVALQESQIEMDRTRDGFGSVRQPQLNLLQLGYRHSIPAATYADAVWNPIFVRDSTLTASVIPVSTGDDSRVRQLSRTVLDLENTPVAVYNVHLRSFRPLVISNSVFNPRNWFELIGRVKDDILSRSREATRILEILSEEERPIVLVGDFNTTPNNWIYAQFSKKLVDTGRASPFSTKGTFPSGFPVARIDYIFASHEFSVVNFYIGNRVYSDHRPVVATLRLSRSE